MQTNFHPLIHDWFFSRFNGPTEPQTAGWPAIAAGENTLIAAPTGSGKTLTAFLVCLDRMVRQAIPDAAAPDSPREKSGQPLDEQIQVVYVSPLKALSNDIERNLQRPLRELNELAEDRGWGRLPIRVGLRTGDTPASQRQSLLRRPPQLLVTTPESLYLMLTSQKAREKLTSVETIIVDEIHALARDKRGSHLALSLERLEGICSRPPQRIGLSATQRPLEQIAEFLVGGFVDGQATRSCRIIDAGHMRQLDLALELPPSQLSAICSHEQWAEIYQRLTAMIQSHRSTLVFVNTRRMAERVSHHLVEFLGEDSVASHHGSLSRPIRLDAEQRLKDGKLKAIVATASLEMGIDIGFIDQVCQIGSPRSIATFLQRVGRSGHSVGAVPKGRLFPLTRDELLESVALVRAVREGRLDAIEIPHQPLDILAQQIVAEVACGDWDEEELWQLLRKAAPYRWLSRGDYDAVLKLLSEPWVPGSQRGVYLHRDRINGQLRARRAARLSALTSGGAIPETAEYRVVTEEDQTFVGTVDEDFAIESLAGDVFLLGNTSWRIRYVRGGEVVVSDAEGAPPTIPFWFGEAPGRTIELSNEVSRLRREVAEQLRDQATDSGDRLDVRAAVVAWLQQICGLSDPAAGQATEYIAAELEAIGTVPTESEIVFERFFDESGGMQLVIHSPLGSRINRAWGLALRKRFCRSFDFELQAAADDNGIVLSLSPQHSFPLENMFKMLGTHNGQFLLEQALLAVPMFQVRWRWNVTRALTVLRWQGGKRVAPHLQRFRADDLLAATFPETVGCLENHHGDVEIPDHPLVRQTIHDCLHEAMDLNRWLELLGHIEDGSVKLTGRDTREPSPFCHELLNANPYAFLDDAGLEERRTRAVVSRRGLGAETGDLSQLDAEAIRRVRLEAWPVVRDAEELHDALMNLVLLGDEELGDWRQWLNDLIRQGRASQVTIRDQQEEPSTGRTGWIACERWPLISAIYDAIETDPPVVLPPELDQDWDRSKAVVEMIAGRIQVVGPTTAQQLAKQLCLRSSQVNAALEALEGRGSVMRGAFTPRDSGELTAANSEGHDSIEWCQRNLLARIHRLTLVGLRQQVQPVEPVHLMRFLLEYHHLRGDKHDWGGPNAVRESLSRLQGYELPAVAWERSILEGRVTDYEPQWLDQLFLSGELTWGRLRGAHAPDKRVSTSALSRVMPLSLMLRDDLGWLLPPAREQELKLRSNAEDVLQILQQRGALFLREIATLSKLLATHVEEALRELAAVGLVTCDGFHAVRSFLAPRQTGSRRRRPPQPRQQSHLGRWSIFPGIIDSLPDEARIQHWCEQLLRRYGIVFRDLLRRESAAPSWPELVRALRRMELRGEVRGGRFVSGVSGEQYALESTVDRLREIRDRPLEDDWVVISAADPLNLEGIINDRPRVTSIAANALILQAGRCVAVLQGGDVTFQETPEPVIAHQMRLALQRQSRRRRDHLSRLRQS